MDDIKNQMQRQAEAAAAEHAHRRRDDEARQREASRPEAAALSSLKVEWLARRRAYDEMVSVFLNAMQESGKFGHRGWRGRYVWAVKVWTIGQWRRCTDFGDVVSEYCIATDGELWVTSQLDEKGRPTTYFGRTSRPLTEQVVAGRDDEPPLDTVQRWLAETLGRNGIVP